MLRKSSKIEAAVGSQLEYYQVRVAYGISETGVGVDRDSLVHAACVC